MYTKVRTEIKYSNGIIVGHLYSPSVDTGCPCVVICHEFGFDQNWETKYAVELAKRSYYVFVFDFPGSGNGCSTGRKTTGMSVLTEVGDLKTVCDYLRVRLRNREIVLCGFSMGGMVSALAAAEIQDIRGLMLIYPAFSISDDALKGKALGARFDPHDPPESFYTKYPPVKLGRKFVEDALSLEDWLDRISAYEGPVLLMHGENDRIVPIIYSEMAASIYKNVKFVRIPHAGHIFWQPWIKSKAIQKMIVFLATLKLQDERESSDHKLF